MSKRRNATAKKPKRAAIQKLPAKPRLRAIADDLWSLAVKIDWAMKCAVCKTTNDLQSHHLIKRCNCNAHRYTLDNGICLCANHHQWNPHCSPHNGEVGFVAWLYSHHPQRIHWVLEHQSDKLESRSVSQGFYLEKIKGLRQYVEDDDFQRIVGVRLCEYLSTHSSVLLE